MSVQDDGRVEFAIMEAFKSVAGIITQVERQKLVKACVEYGANDDGTTANLIYKKAME